jgi:uncharacterized protein YjbI with pentapeptide repeats
VIEGLNWCIFHLPDKKGKLVKEFQRLIDEEKSSQERLHPDFLDFTGFSFPSPVIVDGDLPNVCFKDAVFHDYVLFWNVKGQERIEINGNAWFKNSLFMDVADFSEAKFQDAWFNNARFKGLADFSRSFFRRAHFNGVEFEDDSRFTETSFQIYADFTEARFREDGDFTGAHSEGEVSFNGSNFQNAWFTRSNFKKVDFCKAIVFGEIDTSESDILFEK